MKNTGLAAAKFLQEEFLYMNDNVRESDFDSLLVLLPGSAITGEGIRLLCTISGFDDFIIENKLNTKLPQILCPIASRDIQGLSGDRLQSLKIKFLAVKKKFFALPFNPFMVVSCCFGNKGARFYNSRHDPAEIHNEENILMIEGIYRTTGEKVALMAGTEPDFGMKPKKVTPVYSTDLKTCRFVMLYKAMDPEPLVFIDSSMDYTFLGSEKKMTVTDNFNALKSALEMAFGRKTNRMMMQHGYVLEQVRSFSERKSKKFGFKGGKEMVATAISNEASTNRMSQLLFFQWCQENGWIRRIIPGV